MLKSLKSFPIIKGVRGKEGISIEKLSDTIVKLSILPMVVPEIIEMDINPLIGEGKQIYAVDSRIILE
jgi:acetyltransferase